MTSLERRIAAVEAKASSATAIRAARPAVPLNVIDFATSPDFLNIKLYPVQALLIKLITLALDLLTHYDLQVLEEETDFVIERDDRRVAYAGTRGVTPDWRERIQSCRDGGLSSFTEVVLVLGRRGGKGFVAAVLVAWRIWELLLMDNPQERLGISGGKALHIPVVGSSSGQAKRDAFGDVRYLLTTAPCFKPFLGSCTDTQVTLLTPQQLADGALVGRSKGLIRVSAHPTTGTAVRGLAAPVIVLDEFAHQAGAGSTSDSATIYKAARPALAQFRDPMVIQTSSPWEKTGQFFQTYKAGLELDPASGAPAHPEIFVAQLDSWTAYRDWHRAESIPMWPGGPAFAALTGAIITKAGLEPQFLLDPESAKVEYGAQWAAAVNAYLPRWRSIFEPYKGMRLEQQERGSLGEVYVMHCDPARSGANFAMAIGHLEVDADGISHVVFDVLHVWRPQDFPDQVINYVTVIDELFDYATRFPLSDITFDQFNSAGAIDTLRQRIAETHFPRRPRIFERTATAPHNWKSAEIFKSAVNLDLIRAPLHELAAQELEHLQIVGQRVIHPTTGPVRSKDLADAMMGVTFSLLEERYEALFSHLATLRLGASQPGPGAGQDAEVIQALRDFGKARLLRQRGGYYRPPGRRRR